MYKYFTVSLCLLILSSCYDLNNPRDPLSANFDERLVSSSTTSTVTNNGVLANGIYRIENLDAGLNLKLDDYDGAPIYNSTYIGSDDQKWQVTELEGGSYSIRSVLNNRAITSTGGSVVSANDYTGAASQAWFLTDLGSGNFRLENGSLSATVQGLFDGNPMQAQTFDSGDDKFKWLFLTP